MCRHCFPRNATDDAHALDRALAAAHARLSSRQILKAGVGFVAVSGSALSSRSQESEADHIGILLIAKAAYDPRESVHLWERMNQMGGGSAPGIPLDAHPNPETRITQPFCPPHLTPSM
jgi:metalloendopeptidase OMA1, mitochondrial